MKPTKKQKNFTNRLKPLLIFLVALATIQTSRAEPDPPLQVNSEPFLNQFYLNTDPSYHLRIRYSDTIKNSENIFLSVDQLKVVLREKKAIYKNVLEISGYSNVFSLEPNATLIDLIFGLNPEFDKEQVQPQKFQMNVLDLSNNALTQHFLLGFAHSDEQHESQLNTTLYQLLASELFSKVSLLKLSFNNIQHLRRDHFELFVNQKDIKDTMLETLLLDSNDIHTIQHDTFYDLVNLKQLDLSRNKLKLIHPLTLQLSRFPSLFWVDLSHNDLVAIFDFNESSEPTTTSQYSKLRHFYLNDNSEIKCDCALTWLLKLRNEIQFGSDFECTLQPRNTISLKEVREEMLREMCAPVPELVVNTEKMERVSNIPLFKRLSKAWFAWTVIEDDLPVTTPMPYLVSQETNKTSQLFEEVVEAKRVYHSWVLDDIVFECSVNDTTETAIVWKTQYGYLSNMDPNLLRLFSSYDDHDLTFSNNNTASYKIFYHLAGLTKIHKNFTIRVGRPWATQTKSEFYVNEKNQLVVTNLRNVISGPFSCMAINEHGMRVFEYDIHVRTGVSEYFILSLFVSLISMIVPSILGLIVCCVCEYEADKNYPMTPPCYPTPMTGSTPPNFDFNEWMQNAASYLPNINIHDTLEQVSKKLRKGMEKASVTVKSLGVTSSAYIYSMYEQSSQRLSDMRSYVPSLNVPTLSMPSMRYPKLELTNRMRSGVGNMFIHFRQFCGTSDLAHTASIVNIESDTNASQAVGHHAAYMMEQLGSANSSTANANSFTYYQKFLQLIKEEQKRHKSKKTPISSPIKINEEESGDFSDSSSEDEDENNLREQDFRRFNADISTNNERENVPTTSAYASSSSGSNSSNSVSSSKKNDSNGESGESDRESESRAVPAMNMLKTKLEYSDDDEEEKSGERTKLQTTAI